MTTINKLLKKLRKQKSDKKRAIGFRNIFWQAIELLEPMYPDDFWFDIMDIFSDNGALFVIVNSDGRLYRHTITVEGDIITVSEGIEVMQSFVPLARQMTINRQEDGRVRVTQIVASSVLNRNSEIDSTVLFDNFIKRAETTGEYPIIDFLHYNDVRLGQTDYLARAGYCYIASWVFDDTEVGRIAGESFLNDTDYWGASIQFTPIEAQMVRVAEDVDCIVYVDGINTFISILPENRAGNLFTANKVEGVVKNMNDQDFLELVKLLNGDEDLARKVSEMATQVNNQITDKNMIARQADDTTPESTETDDSNTEADTETLVQPLDIDETLVAEIARTVIGLPDFNTAIQALLPELPKLPEDLVSRSMLDEVIQSVTQLGETVVNRLDTLEALNIAAVQQWQADQPRNSKGAPSPQTGGRQVRFRPREVRNPDNSNTPISPVGDSATDYVNEIADSRPGFASY